jgi:aspartate 4-decarboxylase
MLQDMNLKQYEKLGPFEIKDFLAKVASKSALESSSSYLNAGRGNPNWVATEPREAFFLLGQFAVLECKRVLDLPPGVGGMPKAPGINERLEAWLKKQADMPGASLLQAMIPWAVKKFGFDADKFVHELVDSIIGDHYPVPDRMLVHNEQIVHEYLQWAMCGTPRPKGKFKIYAVEGGTAAMCYIFKSLKSNRILNQGDTIALGVPIFTPYLEMAHLEDYDLHFVEVHAQAGAPLPVPGRGARRSCSTRRSRPSSSSTRQPVRRGALARDDQEDRRRAQEAAGLILLTDDVYGTFVPGFRSLLGRVPGNTIGVYSYSKYFGCTGWRLGTIAVHEDNIFDERIAAHPESIQKLLDKRYGGPHARAAQDRLHRPHRGGQPRRRAESHGGAVAPAAGHDDAVLAERADGREEGLPEGLHRHRQEARRRDDRGAWASKSARTSSFDYYYGLIDFEFFAASTSARTWSSG